MPLFTNALPDLEKVCMYRVLYLILVIVLGFLTTLIPTWTHVQTLESEIIRFSNELWLFLACVVVGFLFAAWFVRAKMKDGFSSCLFLALSLALLILVLPMTIFQRMEITTNKLIFRRAPPFNSQNVELAFGELSHVKEKVAPNWMFEEYPLVGYQIVGRSGQTVEIPPTLVGHAARDSLVQALNDWNIHFTRSSH